MSGLLCLAIEQRQTDSKVIIITILRHTVCARKALRTSLHFFRICQYLAHLFPDLARYIKFVRLGTM
jgi:hypothetical protein